MTCRPASRRQTSAYWATPQDTRLTVRTPPFVQAAALCTGRLQPHAAVQAAALCMGRLQPHAAVQAAASVYPGVGDDAESWAIDGVRKLKWYKGQARHSE